MIKISILIPVYNEEATIIYLLKSVQKEISKIKTVNFEIIVIDDCSNDNTSKLLRENENLYNHVISLEKNQGKGGAILQGLEKAKGEFILFQDADLEYDPNNFKKLIDHLTKNKLDAVFGSRIKNNEIYFYYKTNRFAVILLTKLINLLYRGTFTDAATNHKLIKSEVLKNLNLTSKGFNLDFEISLKLAKYNYRYDEVGIEYYPRTYKDGKKN